jgi:RNA polymerase sigma-70 factor (ECF subfamily)
LQEGQLEAYNELVERYRDRLFTFLRFMVKDPRTAEDLLQETFIRFWRYRMNYKPVARFSTWIYTIAGNLARSELRRLARKNEIDIAANENTRTPDFDFVDPAAPVDTQVHRRMTREAVRRAIDKLPDDFREVIILRELQELSYEEIVELLSLPLGTVKSRINRARTRLRELLTGEV